MSDAVVSAARIIAGHCPNPECVGRPIAVLNNGETWPLVECSLCGWEGDTTKLVNRRRLDSGWRVSDEYGPERELRP